MTQRNEQAPTQGNAFFFSRAAMRQGATAFRFSAAAWKTRKNALAFFGFRDYTERNRRYPPSRSAEASDEMLRICF